MPEINFVIAFVAGFLTFFSPCLIPIVPAYITYISGVSLAELRGSKENNLIIHKKLRKRIIKNSIFFVFGFSLIFVLLGLTATSLGMYLNLEKFYLQKFGGVLLVLLGVYLSGFIKIRFFYKEFKIKPKKRSKFLEINSFLVGAAFAFSWTPCIGPILSGILFLASLSGSLWQSAFLLSSFAAGIAIPFLLIGISIGHSMKLLSKLSKYSNLIKYLMSLILITVGVLMFSGKWDLVTGYFIKLFLYN